MKLEKSEQKLEKYYQRLDKGKASRIKLDDVDHVIRKLRHKRKKVAEERENCERKSKRDRLKRKLAVIEDQLQRARWLKDKISDEAK